MSELLSPKVELFADTMHGLYCPGCKWMHHIGVVKPLQNGAIWDWDGNKENPTYSPSILTQFRRFDVDVVCHSFVRNGQWHFLSDCTHALAGTIVDMVDIPESQL